MLALFNFPGNQDTKNHLDVSLQICKLQCNEKVIFDSYLDKLWRLDQIILAQSLQLGRLHGEDLLQRNVENIAKGGKIKQAAAHFFGQGLLAGVAKLAFYLRGQNLPQVVKAGILRQLGLKSVYLNTTATGDGFNSGPVDAAG